MGKSGVGGGGGVKISNPSYKNTGYNGIPGTTALWAISVTNRIQRHAVVPGQLLYDSEYFTFLDLSLQTIIGV